MFDTSGAVNRFVVDEIIVVVDVGVSCKRDDEAFI